MNLENTFGFFAIMKSLAETKTVVLNFMYFSESKH